jgi:hypothetical protein
MKQRLKKSNFQVGHYKIHQGMCLKTPARTKAASVNASSTAQVSSENRLGFALNATFCA